MPNAGIMASSVHLSGTCTDVLREPFSNLSAWTGTGTIVAGRTGTCARVTGSSQIDYAIPVLDQSATVTLGFAHRVSTIAATRCICILRGAGVSNQTTLQVQSNGSLVLQIGGTTGGILGTSATGLITINTWYYIEIQATLHDTAGAIKVKVDGVEVLNLSGIDTLFTGAVGSVYDAIVLAGGSASGTTRDFDDLYLSTGSACLFKGDQVIV